MGGWVPARPGRRDAGAASAIRRIPSTTVSLSPAPPGPVRKNTLAGSSPARRPIDSKIESTRASGSSGPGISGEGRMLPTAGMQFVATRPLSRSFERSSGTTAVLNSRMPIPPAPAARYAASSSSKLAGNVVHSQIPIRTKPT